MYSARLFRTRVFECLGQIPTWTRPESDPHMTVKHYDLNATVIFGTASKWPPERAMYDAETLNYELYCTTSTKLYYLTYKFKLIKRKWLILVLHLITKHACFCFVCFFVFCFFCFLFFFVITINGLRICKANSKYVFFLVKLVWQSVVLFTTCSVPHDCRISLLQESVSELQPPHILY